MKKYLTSLRITATFCATIIGAGIFVLPYVAAQVGFIEALLYFALLIIPIVAIHRLLASIAWSTDGIGSIPEYADKYLGPKIRNFVLFISSTRVVGVLLAYIVLGGFFLQALVRPYFGGKEIFYTLIFFCFASFLIYKKEINKEGEKTDLFALLFGFIVLFIFIAKALPFFDISYLGNGINVKDVALPYGIIMFALWGLHTVPVLKKMAQDNGGIEAYRKAINLGIVISTLFYIAFIAVVLGVSGAQTTQDALSAFTEIIGGNAVKIGFIFALFIILDSFFALGVSLRDIFHKDAKLSKITSWAFACLLPFSLFVMGFRDYVNIISIVGAFLFTIEGIIVIWIYRSFSKTVLQKNPPFYTALLVSFLAGMIGIEFWYFIIK